MWTTILKRENNILSCKESRKIDPCIKKATLTVRTNLPTYSTLPTHSLDYEPNYVFGATSVSLTVEDEGSTYGFTAHVFQEDRLQEAEKTHRDSIKKNLQSVLMLKTGKVSHHNWMHTLPRDNIFNTCSIEARQKALEQIRVNGYVQIPQVHVSGLSQRQAELPSARIPSEEELVLLHTYVITTLRALPEKLPFGFETKNYYQNLN
ncbi:MAG: hypothetical protein ACI8Y7_000738 [Candidatus Woesearchaeota archaeon]|jgi:hypothetical protein